jgi:RNA polymerase sigma-70 factor (ECF subfamily)
VDEPAWQRAYAAGRAAHPGVELIPARFAAAVAERGTHEAVAHAADLFLAIAAGEGDPAAQREVERLLAEAAPSLRRYDASETFVAEVLQRVRIHLFVATPEAAARLARYDGRASLRAWLGVCLTRMGLYLLRTARNAREVPTEWADELVAVACDQPELEAVRARYADIFAAAWRAACATLPVRQRSLLRMCIVEGCTVEHAAATYQVHRVTVWRWLEDAKQKLLDGTRAELGERLAPDDPGTQSLLELVRSQLDLGLSLLDQPA